MTSYNADALTHLDGLDAVRKRPGMYIGSTGSSGLNHLVWEIIDNSVDEALAGHGNKISVTIYPDNSVQVDDNGRGIPTGINSKSQMSGVELALTKLHAGGKFGGAGYKSAGGLHGVGSSVVNALSTRMNATVFQNNKEYNISFQRGITGEWSGDDQYSKFTKGGQLKEKADKRTASEKKNRPTGTTIRWWYDEGIFLKDAKLDIESILTRARTTAFLVSGLRLSVTDKRDPENEIHEEFFFEGGVVDMVDYIAPDKGLSGIHFVDTKRSFKETVPVINDSTGVSVMTELEREVEIKIAFRWGTSYDYTIKSFVNVVNTPNGGTHVRGLESSLLKLINTEAKSRRVLKASDANFIKDDVLEGLTAIVTVGFPEPQFEGQTKSELGNKVITKLVESSIEEVFGNWMRDKKNSTASKLILDKVKNASIVRLTQRANKDLARKKSSIETSSTMPSKLVSCSSDDKNITELQICEGLSALGGLRLSRNSEFQAIYPLKGKPLNTYGLHLATVLDNQELSDLIKILGAGSGKSFNLEELRYKRLIILADGDSDGGHIVTLLINFLYHFCRPMIEDGRVFVALPPLFSITTSGKNKERFYALNQEELDKLIQRLNKEGKKFDRIQRHKGLGEYSPDILSEVVMDPETRTLRQLTIHDAKATDELFELAFGGNAENRRTWITDNRNIIGDEDLDF